MLVCIGNSMTWETKKMVNWKVVYHGLSMIWINLNIIAEDPKKSLGKAHAGTWLIILIDSAAHRAPCVVDGTYLKDPQGSSKLVTKDAGCLESLDPVLPRPKCGTWNPEIGALNNTPPKNSHVEPKNGDLLQMYVSFLTGDFPFQPPLKFRAVRSKCHTVTWKKSG